MIERLGEMRKGSREGIERETKRQFEEKEGLRLLEIFCMYDKRFAISKTK